MVPRPNTRTNAKVAKPQAFNGETQKISGLLMAYRSYIRMKIRNVSV